MRSNVFDDIGLTERLLRGGIRVIQNIALSTSWNSWRCNSGKEIIEEIRELGFNDVELNYSITQSEIRNICKQREKGVINVVSLHNYCPIPEGFSKKDCLDPYSLSDPEEDKRREAVRWTKNTIDWAHTLTAKAVVLHLDGSGSDFKSRKLIEFFNRGKDKNKTYNRLRERIISDRAATKNRFFDAALKSLDELNSYAGERDIKICIENPFFYEQVPNFEEIGIILRLFGEGSSVYYWHDTGHAAIQENLGFIPRRALLENYGCRIAGFHLHDAFLTFDHRPVGLGEIDFSFINHYAENKYLKIMELSGGTSPAEIKLGLEALRSYG